MMPKNFPGPDMEVLLTANEELGSVEDIELVWS